MTPGREAVAEDWTRRAENALERQALSELPPFYIVLRAWPDAPTGWMPEHLEGRWIEFGAINRAPVSAADRFEGAGAVAHPTGHFEYRADGKRAEVWEVRPRG